MANVSLRSRPSARLHHPSLLLSLALGTGLACGDEEDGGNGGTEQGALDSVSSGAGADEASSEGAAADAGEVTETEGSTTTGDVGTGDGSVSTDNTDTEAEVGDDSTDATESDTATGDGEDEGDELDDSSDGEADASTDTGDDGSDDELDDFAEFKSAVLFTLDDKPSNEGKGWFRGVAIGDDGAGPAVRLERVADRWPEPHDPELYVSNDETRAVFRSHYLGPRPSRVYAYDFRTKPQVGPRPLLPDGADQWGAELPAATIAPNGRFAFTFGALQVNAYDFDEDLSPQSLGVVGSGSLPKYSVYSTDGRYLFFGLSDGTDLRTAFLDLDVGAGQLPRVTVLEHRWEIAPSEYRFTADGRFVFAFVDDLEGELLTVYRWAMATIEDEAPVKIYEGFETKWNRERGHPVDGQGRWFHRQYEEQVNNTQVRLSLVDLSSELPPTPELLTEYSKGEAGGFDHHGYTGDERWGWALGEMEEADCDQRYRLTLCWMGPEPGADGRRCYELRGDGFRLADNGQRIVYSTHPVGDCRAAGSLSSLRLGDGELVERERIQSVSEVSTGDGNFGVSPDGGSIVVQGVEDERPGIFLIRFPNAGGPAEEPIRVAELSADVDVNDLRFDRFGERIVFWDYANLGDPDGNIGRQLYSVALDGRDQPQILGPGLAAEAFWVLSPR